MRNRCDYVYFNELKLSNVRIRLVQRTKIVNLSFMTMINFLFHDFEGQGHRGQKIEASRTPTLSPPDIEAV